jgi:hypothetical protein
VHRVRLRELIVELLRAVVIVHQDPGRKHERED